MNLFKREESISNGDVLAIAFLFLLFGFSVALIIFRENIKHGTYEQGQIDAMNGKWKYEMIIKQDTTYKKTRQWD